MEAVPRFCVLGGGLSGLTSAFLLQRSFPLARITVVEHARGRAGQISSPRGSGGQVLECGFQSGVLANKNGREALGLVRLLKLDEEVVSANIENSARRHLFHYGRVQLFPRVPHILRFCPALLAEPIWPRSSGADESVHAFVARRSSAAVADRLADPLCRGMLAGDARRLSVRTCFPRLWFNERRFRSVFVGSMLSTLSAYRRRSWLSLDLLDPLLQRVSAGGRCYTLRQGLGALTTRLEEHLRQPPAGTRPANFLQSGSLPSVRVSESPTRATVEVALSGGPAVAADAVIAAIPPDELARVLEVPGLDVADAGPTGASLCNLLGSITYESVAVVNVSFDSDVFQRRFRGAGYFVGSLEEQGILGMLWDSLLYPDKSGKARLTVYLGGDVAGAEGDAERAALGAVREHLGIAEAPAEVRVTLWPRAVPQYAVGHHQLMRDVNTARLKNLPWLHVVGAGYFGTRGAADEIVDARQLTDSLARRFARFPGLVENETEEDVAQRYGGGFDAD